MKSIILLFLIMFAGAEAQPQLIAHRGASFIAPENTGISYEIAFEMGAKAAECDIYMTKDNQIVLSHDANLRRTAGINIDITKSNYDEIKNIDVGSFKNAKYKGETIPLLKDILEMLPAGTQFFVEIKDDKRIIPYLKQVLDNSGKKSQIVIIAFNYEVLKESKSTMLDIPHYWLIFEDFQKKDVIKKIRESGIEGVNAKYSILDSNFIAAIKDEWYKCYAWTVNDPLVAMNLTKWGINGITTDRPQWLYDYLSNDIKVFPKIFAHNDYENKNPLLDAISNGCYHIEIDIHIVDGELIVSHDKPQGENLKTIVELYISPLRELMMKNQGSALKNSTEPITFMLDIKGDSLETYKLLKEKFMPYKDYISRIENGEFIQGYIRFFISGNCPVQTILDDELQMFGIDGRPEILGKGISSDICPVISAYWYNVIKWNGESDISETDLNVLKELADKAHKEGKKLRLWGNPDNENVWQVHLNAGIDLINTDKLAELRQYLIEKGNENEY
jgi:glycerophosphoryl diester phosphodiesterase